MVVYNGALYFQAAANDGAGYELWKYDPTNGAQRAADIDVGAGNSNPAFMTVFSGAIYFQADANDGAGYELWKYDSVNGAQRVTDIYSGVGNFSPSHLVVYNNALYFQGYGNDGKGDELWKYDTTNGAQRVADINDGSANSFPSYLTVYNGALYFQAISSDGSGTELWKYDPTYGPQRVADIYSGSGSSTPAYLCVYNGALYFQADGNDSAGRELWKYDPTSGAQRIADIYTGSGSSDPAFLAVYNNALYFGANGNNGSGIELWKYDTTSTDLFRSAAGHDGWILESGENSNAGGSMNTTQTTFNIGDDAQDKQYRSIVSFDTSTLPDGAVITSVKIKLRKQGSAGTNPFTTHGNVIVDIMKGSFGGNNALQTGDFQATASKSNAGTMANSATPWFTANLNKTAFSFINKTGVTQFRLRFTTDDNDDTGADYLKFFSGNTTALANRPLLEIKYYIP